MRLSFKAKKKKEYFEIPGREHIDKKKLQEDLLYRVDYMKRFMQFDKQDATAIKASASLITPLVPFIVNTVYEKLFSFDITVEPFALRNSDFSGKVEDLGHITLESELVKHRKGMLSKYLGKLVNADYNDPEFIAYLDYIGKLHTLEGKRKNVDGTFVSIDYIHCGALFGWIQDILHSAILNSDLPFDQKESMTRAFSKLLWLQNDLFARHYGIK